MAIGDVLAAVIGNGLQGFVQGRKERNRQNLQAEEIQKRDERLAKKDQIELEDRERKRQGELDFIKSISDIGRMNPDSPLSQFSDLEESGLIAASRAGVPFDRAQALLKGAARNTPELSALDQARLDTQIAKTETETARASSFNAQAQQRLAKTREIRQNVRNASKKDKQKEDNLLTQEIADAQTLLFDTNSEDNPRLKKTLIKRLDQLASELGKRHNINIPKISNQAEVDSALNMLGINFFNQPTQVPFRPGSESIQKTVPVNKENEISDSEISDYLKQNGKPVTPGNIEHVRKQLNAR